MRFPKWHFWLINTAFIYLLYMGAVEDNDVALRVIKSVTAVLTLMNLVMAIIIILLTLVLFSNEVTVKHSVDDLPKKAIPLFSPVAFSLPVDAIIFFLWAYGGQWVWFGVYIVHFVLEWVIKLCVNGCIRPRLEKLRGEMESNAT